MAATEPATGSGKGSGKGKANGKGSGRVKGSGSAGLPDDDLAFGDYLTGGNEEELVVAPANETDPAVTVAEPTPEPEIDPAQAASDAEAAAQQAASDAEAAAQQAASDAETVLLGDEGDDPFSIDTGSEELTVQITDPDPIFETAAAEPEIAVEPVTEPFLAETVSEEVVAPVTEPDPIFGHGRRIHRWIRLRRF